MTRGIKDPKRVVTTNLQPGQELAVTLTATVASDGWFGPPTLRLPNGQVFTINQMWLDGVKSVEVHPAPPKWQDHDVIAVRFHEGGIEYTYTRARGYWPGVTVDQTDAKIDELFRKGFVRHLVRNNQVVVGK